MAAGAKTNELAALLGLDVQGAALRESTMSRQPTHLDRSGQRNQQDAGVTLSALGAKMTELGRATTMLFSPEGYVRGDARSAVSELIPGIIRHHQQLRGMRYQGAGSFDADQAFITTMKKMANGDGTLIRPQLGGTRAEAMLVRDFVTGVKEMCRLIKPDASARLLTTLENADWLNEQYRGQVPGIRSEVHQARPELASARKLLGI